MLTKGKIYRIAQSIIPAPAFKAIKKTRLYGRVRNWSDRHLKNSLAARWCVVTGGLLKGRRIFVDPDGPWKEMVTGDYDAFFVSYLESLPLAGKTVYDIGAHFGYSSMCFAQLVGGTGVVHAFEPNGFNRERFDLLMTENRDLGRVIRLHDFAVADRHGEEDFVFSYDVDGGASSGSFLGQSHTFFEKGSYERERGFRRAKVKTHPIDAFAELGIKDPPYLMKIDVEGAESAVLEGARQTLAKHHPILLMEIHSIFNMFKVGEFLRGMGYSLELLKEETDGRCFIAATWEKPQGQ